MRSTGKGGNTAIAALGTGSVGEGVETDDFCPMSGRTAVGVAAVLVVVVALALLPAVVGLVMVPVPAGWLVAGLGGLAAGIGGAKLSTAIWVAMARPPASRGTLSASASID